MNRFFVFCLWGLGYGLGSAQTLTPSENYRYERRYLEAVTLESPNAKQHQSVTYFDGVGREKQHIEIGATPSGKDLVTPFEYDAFGRAVKSFLPLPQSGTTSGAFYPVVSQSLAQSLYGDPLLYAEKQLENSPLDRVLQQAAPGTPWSLSSGKTIKYAYELSQQSDQVKRFATTTAWTSGASISVLTVANATTTQPTTFYANAQLYKYKITNEDGAVRYEFKNGLDQTLLIREVNGALFQDTYYIYNEYGQLAFVLPPLAAEAAKNLGAGASVSSTTLDTLSYQYRYDGQSRLVEKKLPGKGWEYYAYDHADRLAMHQDAELRLSGLWSFTRYDGHSRVVYTGFTPGAARTIEQTALSARSVNHETRTATPFTHSGLSVYYTNTAYPTLSTASGSRLLSVQYYDTYPLGSPTRPSNIVDASQPTLPDTYTSYTVNGHSSVRSTNGLPTATYLNLVEGPGSEWTKDYYYYDLLARKVATHRFNQLGGYSKTEDLLNFSAQPTLSFNRHKRSTADLETTLKDRRLYDAKGRLSHHYHQVNTLAEELLSQSTYDELQRLSSQKVGGSLTSPLQTLAYTYNIRGWLTGLGLPSNLGSSLFAYTLRYEDPVVGTGATAKYNGSISQVDWSSKTTPTTLRRYSYTYDESDRLIGAFYSKPGASSPATGAYDEQITYDLNGNIKNLTRYGGSDSLPLQKIDQLQYTYSGNRLSSVVDQIGNPQGYPLGGAVITYNSNGSMISHLDKGISSISYNALNLPSTLVQDTLTTKYTYLATGSKLKKTRGLKTTEYLGGFQYETSGSTAALQFVPTAQGYYDFIKNAYIYNYVDHLGSVRLSYRKNSAGALEILEQTNYYPFGLRHEGYGSGSTATPSYHYKYNGKELQETGMYDYGARMYMPDIGRWGVVDPLAEKYPNFSPYAYAFDNPINLIDPDGREPVPSYYRLNPWFRLKSTQWYSTVGVYDSKTFNAAASYSTQHLSANAFQSVYQRSAYYGWVQGQVDAKGYNSKWFGAAQLVTGLNAVGGTEIPDHGIFTSAATDKFLQGGNKFLFSNNMKNAKDFLADGKLSGGFTDANGNKQSFNGLSGMAFDNKMVEFEQSKVQEYINGYKGKNLKSIIGNINELMTNPLGPSEISEVMDKSFNGGKSFDFKNYGDRVKLGQELIKKAHK